MKLNRLLLAVVLLPLVARADDWPAWRGPNRDAICRETGLLQKWPAGGPKLLWKKTGVGEGYSGPAIVGNVLYTMGNLGGEEVVLALDVDQAGKEVWATRLGAVQYKGNFPGTRCTPTIDGPSTSSLRSEHSGSKTGQAERLYVVGASGRLACLAVKTGKVIWRRSFVTDFGGVVPRWAYAESVLIDGDLLLCTPGGPKGSIAALDKATGKTVWASKFGDKASYSSIVKASVGGVKQYVAFTFEGVVGVAADSGKLLWRYRKPGHTAEWGNVNVMTPIWSDETVFASSNYKVGGGLARIVKTGDVFKAEQVYFTKKMENHHGGVILLDGALYGASNPRILRCLDHKTGKVLWESREPGKCSLIYADGLLYCRNETGPICLVKATSRSYQLMGKFDQPDRSKQKAWPHPVIAHGRLYIRDQDILLCYDVRDPKRSAKNSK